MSNSHKVSKCTPKMYLEFWTVRLNELIESFRCDLLYEAGASITTYIYVEM